MAEHNLIQAPELLRRLSRAVGIRQAHIAPALSEGIQPVILVADVTHQSDQPDQSSTRRVTYAVGAISQPAVNLDGFHLFFPILGGTISPGTTYRLKYMRISTLDAVGGQVRWGLRASSAGAEIANSSAHPNLTDDPNGINYVGPLWRIGSGATNTLFVSAHGYGYLTAGSPIEFYGDDYDVTLRAGGGVGWGWQTFGRADSPTLATFSLWDEITA